MTRKGLTHLVYLLKDTSAAETVSNLRLNTDPIVKMLSS